MSDIFKTFLHIFRGETKAWTIPVKDSAGNAVDITNRTLTFTVKAAASDTTAVFTKSTGSGIAHTTPISGIATLTIDNSDTDIAAIPRTQTTLYWWLHMTSAGEPQVIAYGLLVISPR